MADIECPQKCNNGFHHSSGDGWDEWDECSCCNPKGGNETGMTTTARVAEYQAALAAEDARIDAMMKQPCARCGIETWACECGSHWATVQ